MSVSGQVTLLGGHDDLVVLGDKGYMSAPLAQALRAEHALHLLTPPRRNARTPALQGAHLTVERVATGDRNGE